MAVQERVAQEAAGVADFGALELDDEELPDDEEPVEEPPDGDVAPPPSAAFLGSALVAGGEVAVVLPRLSVR